MSLLESTSRASQPRDFSQQRLQGLLSLTGVTWRHDVDESLEAAAALADVEARAGVEATFYVMARSPFYNVFSHAGRELVARIVALGHRVGVHCDLDEPRDSAMSPMRAAWLAERDRHLLALALPGAVGRRLSFHCPPDSLLWTDIPGFECAYAPEWQGRYVADSRGVFAYGDPEDHEARPLQVNLHPEHWFPELVGSADRTGFWR